MSKKQNTLDTFLNVKRKSDLNTVTDVTEPKIPRESPNTNTKSKYNEDEGCSSSSKHTDSYLSGKPEQCEDSVTLNHGHVNDVSYFINRALTDEERLKVLHNCWSPPKNYQFPLIEKFKDKKLKLKFQYQWLDRFNWLVYSETEQGGFCKYCVAFANTGGVGNQPLGHLVKTPFTNWKKALESFKHHNESKYHTDSVSESLDFCRVMNDRSQSIINKIDTDREKQIQKNRKYLGPIVDGIILCGRQEIALRGHRDSGKIYVDDNTKNEGNFRAILKYRAAGDSDFREVLEGPGERSKYVSPSIQNEVIECCNQVILNKLVSQINEAKFFSVLSDETTDISTTEQVAICVRYIHEGKIREDFLQFVETASLKGCDLAQTIMTGLTSFGVDCQYIVGQGYDGAGNMAGKFNGVQAIVREMHPKAIYVHCAAHSLNLAVTHSCEVQAIRNCLGVVQKLYTFFNTPKRKAVISRNIETSELSPDAQSLKRLCATRWISKYDALSDFIELFPFVYDALVEICTWNDSTAIDSRVLICAMDFEFFVSLYVASEIFGYALPLSKLYQKESLDMKECILSSECAVEELQEIRQDAENKFKKVYVKAKSVAESVGIVESTKRICKVQKNRANISTDDKEHYYRVTVFNLFVDHFINQLKERFLNHKEVFCSFMCLFETEDSDDSNREMYETLTSFYAPFVEPNTYQELRLWKSRVRKENLTFKGAIEALLICNKSVFPNVNTLLQILCTLPVSTATPERSFSSLKRIKTYLRNSTGQGRLNGLALLSIHKGILITSSEVIDELSKQTRKVLL